MDLFEQAGETGLANRRPLAARMRPSSIDELIGQEHILGPGKLLRRAIEADRIQSVILYGPPGCGKTSLAEIIAAVTQRRFKRTSGVTANVAVLRDLIKEARQWIRSEGSQTILFVDEIHRFNKSQQDVLLPYVEDGTITLVGATTHNPMVFVNSPLTSRSLIFELRPLAEDAVACLLQNALSNEKGLASFRTELAENATSHIARVCEGDARRALNALEIAVLTTPPDDDGVIRLTKEVMEDSIQKKAVVYDKNEDGHYDTISAFIKSVRGSDPHAAVYWLAKMLYAGEDPRFIARRLVILASEDIGNADPRGLLIATAASDAVAFVGMPEARIILSQATTYLASAPKSNASYLAINKAESAVRDGRSLQVPEHLKNLRVRRNGEDDGKEDEYIYPHDYSGHFALQEYVPTESRFYEPGSEGYEDIIRQRLEKWDRLRADAGETGKNGHGAVGHQA